jgi:hypothetical protein
VHRMNELTAAALLEAPIGRAVLAELVGLDLQDGLEAGFTASAVIAAAAGSADLSRLAGCDDRLLLLSAVARVIDGAQVEARPFLGAVGSLLEPVARALVRAPAARWWSAPLSRSDQRWVGAGGASPARGALLVDGRSLAAAREDAEETEMRRRTLAASGIWWSSLLGGTVITSSGPVDGLPAVALACVADSAGEERLVIWKLEAHPDARVREIGGLSAWAELVSEFPRDVTASRGPVWGVITGREGPWFQPDWQAVAGSWDGIHLSVAGYLTATGRAVRAHSGRALLVGWEPDQTLWLNDVFTRAEPVSTWHGTLGSDAIQASNYPWLGEP